MYSMKLLYHISLSTTNKKRQSPLTPVESPPPPKKMKLFYIILYTTNKKRQSPSISVESPPPLKIMKLFHASSISPDSNINLDNDMIIDNTVYSPMDLNFELNKIKDNPSESSEPFVTTNTPSTLNQKQSTSSPILRRSERLKKRNNVRYNHR